MSAAHATPLAPARRGPKFPAPDRHAPPADKPPIPAAGGATSRESSQHRAVRQKAATIWAKDPHGWYVEPSDCTTALIEAEGFAGEIWDPACGRGNVVTAALQAGLPSCGTDIMRRAGDAPWFVSPLDFLHGPPLPADNIVCNPPSLRAKGTEAFIRRGVPLARRKAAFFVDVRFVFGERRAEGLFQELPPTKIWFITPRCACPPGDFLLAGGKAEGGQGDFVWLVYRKTPIGELAAPEAPGWLVRARSGE